MPTFLQKLWENSKPGTSNVDWCEPNYAVNSYVAEFFNTFTNIPFFIISPLLIYLYRGYTRTLNRWTNSVFYIIMLISVGSMYFHGTLSLVGQLIDEVAIVYVIAACIVLWVPTQYYPAVLDNKVWLFRMIVICISFGMTLLSGFMPYLNSFILMASILPIAYFVYLELSQCKDSRIVTMGMHCLAMWAAAIVIWVCDRAFCSVWLSLGIPYLHAVWHLLSALGPAYIIAICVYFHTMYTCPESQPALHYWPCKNQEQWRRSRSTWWRLLMVPYITLEGKLPNVAPNSPTAGNNNSKNWRD